MNFGNIFEQLNRLFDFHFQNFRDRLLFKADLQCFSIETFTFTDGASHPNVGQKVHFKFVGTVTFTCFAATTFDIETETTWFKAALLGLRKLRKQISNVIENFDISTWIGPWSSPDGRLIDRNHLVEMFHTFDRSVFPRFAKAIIEVPPERFDQDIVDK